MNHVYTVIHGYDDYESDDRVWAVLSTIQDARKYINHEVNRKKIETRHLGEKYSTWSVECDDTDEYKIVCGNKEFFQAEKHMIALLDENGHPTRETCQLENCYVCAERDCSYSNKNHYYLGGCPDCGLLAK